MAKVLVINSGSSSIKWTIFNKKSLDILASGLAERIGIDGSLSASFEGATKTIKADLKNHNSAVREIIKLWSDLGVIESLVEITNIGFRVVQGGNFFKEATVLNKEAIEKIDFCTKYAPLHNPGALMAIKAFEQLIPNAKLSASFDTSFHSTISEINYLYPINKKISDELQIRKFGAHGISHQFITGRLAEVLEKKTVTFVNMHLGNGASLCAIKDSLSIDTSMGLTPLAGIMMGTRSGDIDPSIHQFVMNETGMSIDDFTKVLNNDSGLLGVSQISSDMRDIMEGVAKGNKDAKLAFELYAQKVVDYLAIYANKIGPHIDALVFTAGVGEHTTELRERIIEKVKFARVKLTSPNLVKKIAKDVKLISSPESAIPVYVISTNEEVMIAREALALEKK